MKNLTKEKASQVLSKALEDESLKRVTVLLYAKDHNIDDNIKPSFIDVNQWKKTRIYN